jgi:hypothetical protein
MISRSLTKCSQPVAGTASRANSLPVRELKMPIVSWFPAATSLPVGENAKASPSPSMLYVNRLSPERASQTATLPLVLIAASCLPSGENITRVVLPKTLHFATCRMVATSQI